MQSTQQPKISISKPVQTTLDDKPISISHANKNDVKVIKDTKQQLPINLPQKQDKNINPEKRNNKDSKNNNINDNVSKRQQVKSVDVPIENGNTNTNRKSINQNTKFRTLKWSSHNGTNNNNAMKRMQRLYTQMPITAQGNKNYNKTGSIKYDYSAVPRVSLNHTSITHESRKKSFIKNMMTYIDQVDISKQQKRSSNYNKQHPPFGTKQQLYEQNLQLKSIINELKDSLTRQKISTQAQKRKNKKYTLKLSRQFKKDFYYSHQNKQVDIQVQQLEHSQDQEPQDEQEIAKMYQNNQNQENKVEQNEVYNQKLAGSYSDLIPNFPQQNSSINYKQYKYLQKPNLSSMQSQKGFAHTQDYMIAGIKQKYEQLKSQNEKLSNQLKLLKSMDARKKLQQISVYCMVLQESNKKLAAGLHICKQKLSAYEGNSKNIQQIQKNAEVCELLQKINSLKAKNSKVRQQNKKLCSQQRQSAKLIIYLEQLVISKQNLQYKSTNSLKKLTKILTSLQLQLHQQKQYSRNLKQTFTNQLEQVTVKCKQKMEKQKLIFEQAIIEKNAQIKKLEKQMNYMMTIIDNWKLSDTKQDGEQNWKIAQKKRKKSEISNKIQYNQQEGSKAQSLGAMAPVAKISERMTSQKDYQQKVSQLASVGNRSQTQQQVLARTNTQKSEVLSSRPFVERKRKTSGVKHSENCRKMRKVAIEQVSQLAQYIRYRMIGSNIQLEQICKYLQYRPIQAQKLRVSASSDDVYDELEKWKKIYINQAQLIAIFIQQPFKLKPQDASNLGRYIIEDECFYENNDQNNGFVYMDFENQIDRGYAKSVMKAFLQTQSTNFLQPIQGVNQFHACEEEWKEVLQKRGVKINTPLVSIAPNGFITKQKWNELLNSTNGQTNQNLMEWCIGRMLIESQGLNKLKYRAIVPEGL